MDFFYLFNYIKHSISSFLQTSEILKVHGSKPIIARPLQLIFPQKIVNKTVIKLKTKVYKSNWDFLTYGLTDPATPSDLVFK